MSAGVSKVRCTRTCGAPSSACRADRSRSPIRKRKKRSTKTPCWTIFRCVSRALLPSPACWLCRCARTPGLLSPLSTPPSLQQPCLGAATVPGNPPRSRKPRTGPNPVAWTCSTPTQKPANRCCRSTRTGWLRRAPVAAGEPSPTWSPRAMRQSMRSQEACAASAVAMRRLSIRCASSACPITGCAVACSPPRFWR